MNQPCYNSIALARHQHEIDRQEAKEHWIAAAVDRLMDDEEWLNAVADDWYEDACAYGSLDEFAKDEAARQAGREYQQHLSELEQARIDAEVGYD